MDLMAAFDVFWHIDTRNFHVINEALIVLLPRSAEAVAIKDFRPISLMHVLSKLFSKMLANRQALRLGEMIHVSQSAFMKGRFIQDNFKVVQGTAKLLHARKWPSLLVKVDIARAFDSVAWPFLLKVLQHKGFPAPWRDWVSVLLSIASTKVMLTSVSGKRICHGRGLRQRDPLSPMLFIIVMEALSALLHHVEEWGLLKPLPLWLIPFRASLYVDDLILFLSPVESDMHITKHILAMFEKASGLGCNLGKCHIAPIRCDEEQVQLVTDVFPCPIVSFPVKYLGLPLSVCKLLKSSLLVLVDQMGDCLLAWKGRLLHRSGRLSVIMSTLVTIPVYTAMSQELLAWLLHTFEKNFKAFLWTGSKAVHGGKCLVA
jgi:hypothetical protein